MPAAQPTVQDFFHKDSSTCSFVCYDAESKDAIIIDPVMDLDVVNWQVSHAHNDTIIEFVKEKGLKVHFIMDTHVHADHITGTAYLHSKFGAPVCIGEKITVVRPLRPH